VTGGPYWPGQDVARALALRGNTTSGYVLHASGAILPFGGAPGTSGGPVLPGFDVFRDIVLLPDDQSGYLLDGAGGIHTFGGAPALANPTTWPGWDVAVGFGLGAGPRGVTVDAYRRVHAFG
jgi:hypothetical protein